MHGECGLYIISCHEGISLMSNQIGKCIYPLAVSEYGFIAGLAALLSAG
jgi:hypothetical protein